jgi:putative ABC transport system ATP-binding protein
MITLKDLTKEFPSPEGKVTAVDRVSLHIGDGKFAAIVGKSGSGKSSILNLLGTLDSPTSGSIKLDDQEVSRLRGSALTKYRREKIGFVFQNYQLIPNLTALENVMLPMEFAGIKKKERLERALHLLKEVGIDESQAQRRPGKLSGGQQQRVSIARALANKPRLILADEPTGNLDSKTGKIIVDLLKDLARSENTTIVCVTHDPSMSKSADLTFTLKDGKLVDRLD